MTMRTFAIAAVSAGALLLASSIATGQESEEGSHSGSPSGMEMGPGMMMGRGMGRGMGMMMGGCHMMGGRMSSHTEGRIAFLKAEIAITDAQQAQWTAYTDALRKNFANMQSMHDKMKKAMGAKPAVERLDQHISGMEARLSALKEIKVPLSALYDGLSADQKKKADELLTGMGCMM